MQVTSVHSVDLSTALENTTDITPVGHGLEIVAAAGIVGGLVYWLIAGRNAGAWREPRRPLRPPPPLPAHSPPPSPRSPPSSPG